ncbi:MAG TPA: response regulator transcription factor [Capsulimonadaceae bacterium]|jgi:two-component system copper resistance phosphate regulon response regulator CusR
MKILVIEDDPLISEVVKTGLEQSHYKVDTAFDGETGYEMAIDHPYHVIVLDLMLPRMDGMTVCRNLREHKIDTPIIMLTARDAVSDRVKGLENGADDYLPKPFDFRELLARIRALQRRDNVHKTQVIHVADLTLDTTARRVTRAGREITLTPREYSLLEALAAHEGQVLSREVIQERVWLDDNSYSNTVDAHIKSLRKKVDNDFQEKLIQTVFGVGYTLRAPDPEAVAAR